MTTEVNSAELAASAATQPIVCFSHLAWDEKLYQRPQQILSRMATLGHPVYYFACVGYHRHKAEPMGGPLANTRGVYVYTLPYAPGTRRFSGLRRWLAALKVASILSHSKVHRPVLWFYHPLLFPLGYSHSDAAIVYDVMDHFPSFEGTEDDLYYEELTLLAETDVAFTGGRSLDRHVRSMIGTFYSDLKTNGGGVKPNLPLCDIHCFPSGIDLQHFAKALTTSPSPLAQNLPRPIFGYFGAIDERLDWDLIRQLACATEGSVVLAGPRLQSPPTDLPENVHLTGGIPYSDLPALLASFDVCLIPFKDSPLVSFISPTKTPEYLAGGKPVVSTPIPDVISDYSDVVRVAPAGPQFVSLCLQEAANPPEPGNLAAQASQRTKTWDDIASQMNRLLVTKITDLEKQIHAAR